MNWSVRKWFHLIWLSLSIPASTIASYHDCGPCEDPNDPANVAHGAPPCIPKPPDYRPCNLTFEYTERKCPPIEEVEWLDSFGVTSVPERPDMMLLCHECCEEGEQKWLLDGAVGGKISMRVRTTNRAEERCRYLESGTPVAIPRDFLSIIKQHEMLHCRLRLNVINAANKYISLRWLWSSREQCEEESELLRSFITSAWDAAGGHGPAFAGMPGFRSGVCGETIILPNHY